MDILESLLKNLNFLNLTVTNIYFYLTLILINISIFKLLIGLSNKFNLYDIPNNRKLHLKPISYLGGLFFFVSNFSFFLYYRTYLFESHFLLYNLSNVFSLIIISSLIFVIGLIDDKVDLHPLRKTIMLMVLISSAVLIDNELLIKNLNFEIIERSFNLKNFSFFFTILCIYIFINACNMYDGADLQVGLYFFIFLFYLYFKSNYLNIFTPLLIPLFIFLIANYKKICFLGNNGSHFLSYILAIFVLKFYNMNILNTVEEVVIIMLIPGLDLTRLFFSRVLNNKKFFESDMNHIHHLLFKNNSKNKVQFILLGLNLSPIIIGEISGSYLVGIIFGILIYIFFILRKTV